MHKPFASPTADENQLPPDTSSVPNTSTSHSIPIAIPSYNPLTSKRSLSEPNSSNSFPPISATSNASSDDVHPIIKSSPSSSPPLRPTSAPPTSASFLLSPSDQNQPDNLTTHLFWVPAHQHPEIAPLAFKDWLSRHDMHLTDSAVQRVRRRKSYRESVSVATLSRNTSTGRPEMIISPVGNLNETGEDDTVPPFPEDGESSPNRTHHVSMAQTSPHRTTLKRNLRTKPLRRPSSPHHGIPYDPANSVSPTRRESHRTSPTKLAPFQAVRRRKSHPRGAHEDDNTAKPTVLLSTFSHAQPPDVRGLPLPPAIPPVLHLLTPSFPDELDLAPNYQLNGIHDPDPIDNDFIPNYVVPPERSSSLHTRARVRPSAINELQFDEYLNVKTNDPSLSKSLVSPTISATPGLPKPLPTISTPSSISSTSPPTPPNKSVNLPTAESDFLQKLPDAEEVSKPIPPAKGTKGVPNPVPHTSDFPVITVEPHVSSIQDNLLLSKVSIAESDGPSIYRVRSGSAGSIESFDDAKTPGKKKKGLFQFGKKKKEAAAEALVTGVQGSNIARSPSSNDIASSPSKIKKSSSWSWLLSTMSNSSKENLSPDSISSGSSTEFYEPGNKKKEKSIVASLFKPSSKKSGQSSLPPTPNNRGYANGREIMDGKESMVQRVAAIAQQYPVHIERAICRLAHAKLANPRRPLHHQVLISNMLVWYMSLRKMEEEAVFSQGAVPATNMPTPENPQDGEPAAQDGDQKAVVWKGGRFQSTGNGKKSRKRRKAGPRSGVNRRSEEIIVTNPNFMVSGYASDGRDGVGAPGQQRQKPKKRQGADNESSSDDSDSSDDEDDAAVDDDEIDEDDGIDLTVSAGDPAARSNGFTVGPPVPARDLVAPHDDEDDNVPLGLVVLQKKPEAARS